MILQRGVDMRIADNYRAPLDAAMALYLHRWRHRRAASERGR